MQIKPAAAYKTRTGRRIALVCYMPIILVGIVAIGVGEAWEAFTEALSEAREVWDK